VGVVGGKMIWSILITVVGVLITGLVVWWVMHSIPPRTISSSELLATKEGREKLAGILAKVFPPVVKTTFEKCETCEGFGKLGHHIIIQDGGPAEVTSDEICKDCGGTGIKGGLDYVVIACSICGGKGFLGSETFGPKCQECNGSKVVKVRREDARSET
jgi:hypothetical protein